MPKKLEGTKSSQTNFWANFLLVLGLLALLLFTYLIYQRYNPQKLAFNISEVRANSGVTSNLQPIGIKIDTIDLTLPITSSEIKNNKWEASTKSVNFLKTSAIPGEAGNAILYGHNWPNLLGNLSKTKVGDRITIIYSDNSTKDFEIEYMKKVSPSETSIMENSNDRRITLYTCTGFLDSERLVVVAKLLKA